MTKYIEELHKQIIKRNEQYELYKEIIENMNKTIVENDELRDQLMKCYDFIQRNSYELRNDNKFKEIQNDNMDMIKQKLFFVRGANCICVTDTNYF